MVIEIDAIGMTIGAAVIGVVIAVLVGIRIGRKVERGQWVSLADVQPKNFVHIGAESYTSMSHDEYSALGLIEIEGLER